jgi:hypothetical protein
MTPGGDPDDDAEQAVVQAAKEAVTRAAASRRPVIVRFPVTMRMVITLI